MKLVFYSIILNHHQACLADELYRILGDDYAFVETSKCYDRKGSTEDYSNRPYLIKAWENAQKWDFAMRLAESAEVCVFGYGALHFEKARMRKGLFSFDMGERMLKRGWLNLASPRILKQIMAYHLGNWSNKPIYKLCCSSFAKRDQYKLFSYRNKCYKWGYFIDVPSELSTESVDLHPDGIIRIMWCARFLKLKHPELVVKLARALKKKGYIFQINIYGDEGNASAREEVYKRCKLEELADKYHVTDMVLFHGNKPNCEIISAMRSHNIFLFTSDSREGWGVVANESLANGCVLVSSDAIGSSSYLIKEGYNGFQFKNRNIESLAGKIEWLLNHPEEMKAMQKNAYIRMNALWSPKRAAGSLLQLIKDLKSGMDTSIIEGPCSKA